jgi:hypothetical protein
MRGCRRSHARSKQALLLATIEERGAVQSPATTEREP